MFKKIFGSSGSADDIQMPEIERYNLTVPFYSSLAISPDQNTLCFIGPDSENAQLVASQAASLYFKWSMPVLSYKYSRCTFVGANRIFLETKVDDTAEKNEESTLSLIDSSSGSVVAQKTVPFYFFSPVANPFTGTVYGLDGERNLVIVQTADDQIKHSFADSSAVGEYFSTNMMSGLMIGPGGDCYFLNNGGLNRVKENMIMLVAQMYGHNCAYMDPSGVVYQGGGYADRSGDSELFIYDPKSHTVNRIPFGREPINQILPAEPGFLLMATLTNSMYENQFPKATIMKYSLQERKVTWSYDMFDMPPDRDALLVSVPEEGWAIVRHFARIRKISLSDGKPLAQLQDVNDDFLNHQDLMYRKKNEVIQARWLPVHRLLYLVRHAPWNVGRIEVYWIGR